MIVVEIILYRFVTLFLLENDSITIYYIDVINSLLYKISTNPNFVLTAPLLTQYNMMLWLNYYILENSLYQY